MANLKRQNGLLDPSDVEAVGVSNLADLTKRMLKIGEVRLLYGESPMARLAGEQTKPGALPPPAARDTLTRQAIRRKEERRRAFRSGLPGLLRAIQAAT